MIRSACAETNHYEAVASTKRGYSVREVLTATIVTVCALYPAKPMDSGGRFKPWFCNDGAGGPQTGTGVRLKKEQVATGNQLPVPSRWEGSNADEWHVSA